MAPSANFPSPDASIEASALLSKYSPSLIFSLGHAWREVAALPPDASCLIKSMFIPDTCLDFLKDVSEGKSMNDFYPFSLYGIDRKTHLNILGRIQAATYLLEEDPKNSASSVPTALKTLKNFEADFSAFLQLYHVGIAEGLDRRRIECPEKDQLAPNDVWQKAQEYKIPEKTLCHARFAQKGLKVPKPDDPEEQRLLAREGHLPLRPIFTEKPAIFARVAALIGG